MKDQKTVMVSIVSLNLAGYSDDSLADILNATYRTSIVCLQDLSVTGGGGSHSLVAEVGDISSTVFLAAGGREGSQVAILLPPELKACSRPLVDLSNDHVAVIEVDLPGGQSLVVASIYWRPPGSPYAGVGSTSSAGEFILFCPCESCR